MISSCARRLFLLANNGHKLLLAKRCTGFLRSQLFPTTISLSASTKAKNIEIKKRPGKKKTAEEITKKSGYSNVAAFCTAEEYHLETLAQKMAESQIFEKSGLSKELLPSSDFMHLAVKQENGGESQDVFIFREGAVVAWNLPEIDVEALLSLVKKHQTGEYSENIIRSESESMNYTYSDKKTSIEDDDFVINEKNAKLDKYALSNAMALSVKLGSWEATLANYIDSMEDITEDMKAGRKIKMSQEEVMRKTGKILTFLGATYIGS